MANINGTQSDDTLNGTVQSDVINGFAGDDIIFAQQGGDDVINAGAGEDGILFGAVFTAADQVDGGDGTDGIVLTGDYSAGLTLAATTIANIEVFIFDPGFNYRLTMNDANVVAGQLLVVDASLLGAANSLHFDASAETDGRYTLRGGSGNDVLISSAGNDSIDGWAGDDRIEVFGGMDGVEGGAGTDTLVIDYSAAAGPVTFQFWTFSDGLGNSVGISSIERFEITTGNQNDNLGIGTIGATDDIVFLNGGDDFVDVGYGNDTADGGSGMDGIRVNHSLVTGDIHWDLQANTYSGPTGSFTNFEYLEVYQGSSGNDVLVTTNVAGVQENINTNDGDDIVTVLNGTDYVYCGRGDDTLIVDYSRSTSSVRSDYSLLPYADEGYQASYYDQQGRSVTFKGINRVQLTTGSGDDSVSTADGDDRVIANGGNDIVNVLGGNDYADGGAGIDGIGANVSDANQAITWNLQTNSYSGSDGTYANFEYFWNIATGSGDDTLVTTGLARNDQIWSGGGNDTITILNGIDSARGELGTDTLVVDYSGATAALHQTLYTSSSGGYWGKITGGEGRELDFDSIERFVITATAFNDGIYGTEMDDILRGGGGNDIVFAYQGNDLVEGGAGQDELYGDLGHDTIDGGAGVDIMTGGFGHDIYVVDNGADQAVEVSEGQGTDLVRSSATFTLSSYLDNLTLTGSGNIGGTGNDLANIITGNAGANLLNGGGGADTMIGGAGDDTFVVDAAGDIIVEEAAGGTDTVRIGTTYTLGVELENLVLTGAAAINGTGNAVANQLTGNGAANLLNGGLGVDIMAGGLGDDLYRVDNVGDVVNEGTSAGLDTVESLVSFTLGSNVEKLILTGAGALNGTGGDTANLLIGNASANILKGEGGDDRLEGGSGNDLLEGGADADFLDGGVGSDTMKGGLGDDSYLVGAGDVVTEAASAGIDHVEAAITYVLGANLENLTLAGAAAINGTGNTLANLITGNGAANTLSGGVGADTMTGGIGNDSYVVDNALDQAIETAGAGTDKVTSSVSFTLGDNVESLILAGSAAINGTGNALVNVILGNDGANILNGGTGADNMQGGFGNDSYVVDNALDKVTETSASGGTDKVTSNVSFALGTNVEQLILTGSNAINGTGNGLANTLTGNDGANVLNGGVGADTMAGGNGNDAYVVDNALDKVIETSAAGGTDRVTSAVSFTLGGNVENLTLAGTAAIDGTGNGLANTLLGNAGANVLNGAAGADTMQGGLGSDTYVVDNFLDKAIETSATGGTDLVRSSVSFTLGGNVENLVLLGSAVIDGTGNNGANTVTGNSAANILKGLNGNDVIDGGAGNDELHGGAGNDSLNGGTGADGFVFNTALNAGTNLDHILDFVHAIDEIRLENAVFTTLAAGALSAGAFRLGTAAVDADDRILYDAATGALYYDKDGTGVAAAVPFATLDNMPATLNATDFLVI